MYHAIPKDTLAASITNSDGQIVAIGLGILDRSYMGIYAIHVHPHYRGRQYARSVCTSLLNRGKELGMTGAYLQVVEGILLPSGCIFLLDSKTFTVTVSG